MSLLRPRLNFLGLIWFPASVKIGAGFCFLKQKPYIWHMEKLKQGLPYLILGLIAGFMVGLALQSVFNIL